MARPLILVTAPSLSPPAMRRLQDAAEVETMALTSSAAELEAVLATRPVAAVISRTVPISEAAMAACPTLKVVCKHGAGVDNIDVAGAERLGIPVLATRGTNARSVAEHALALLFAVARDLVQHATATAAGRWTREGPAAVELSDKTLALLGVGSIGRETARLARGIGMRVRAFDPHAGPVLSADLAATRVDDLDTLLDGADALSLHCPLTPETRGLIGTAALARLNRGAILVNTARGGVVDEAALLAALESGQLRGAGLDTLAVEPPLAGHPLAAHRAVVCTPHVGASTAEASQRVAERAVDNVLAVLAGRGVDPADHVAGPLPGQA